MARSTTGHGHPVLFTVFLLVAVYAIVAGTVAMTSTPSCAYGWDERWRPFPPSWECHRDLSP